MKKFTKKDLMTGDIVVTRMKGNAILIGSGFKKFEYLKSTSSISSLENYNEDLIIKGENIPAYDIMKVYRITKESKFDSLEDLINTLPKGKIELIWEREREIDWSKVPKWTRVQVKDHNSDDWMNRYFIGLEYNNYPYLATKRGEFTYEEGNDTGWRQIRIYDKSDIKEEWYK